MRRLFFALCLLACACLAAGCGGGGGGDVKNDTGSSDWDQLVWDQDPWA
jgi:hypothetical protein